MWLLFTPNLRLLAPFHRPLFSDLLEAVVDPLPLPLESKHSCLLSRSQGAVAGGVAGGPLHALEGRGVEWRVVKISYGGFLSRTWPLALIVEGEEGEGGSGQGFHCPFLWLRFTSLHLLKGGFTDKSGFTDQIINSQISLDKLVKPKFTSHHH